MIKSPNLEYLKIYDLNHTTPANRSALLEFAGLATTNSSCLHTLHIESTDTKYDGDKFMKILADDHINWLHHLTINGEIDWIGGRDECLDSLLILLARQTNLQTLTML